MVEGAPWLKHTDGMLPNNFSLTYMKPLPRAWATFLVQTLKSTGNSSEF